ncbi:MAG: hypothetical protein JRH15_20945 [Deltaproteobacteria bacterium]|nr:hypothetical protein [Deltaproteobacteria bacterium]
MSFVTGPPPLQVGVSRAVDFDVYRQLMAPGGIFNAWMADAQSLVPGEVAEIAFDLFPISVRFKKGQRIRVAIAGADKDVFRPIPGCEAPVITIERNARHASFIDLPVVDRP